MENGESPNAERQDRKGKPNLPIWEMRASQNLLFDTRVIGQENIETIPQGKNIIIVATHISAYYDIPLVISAVSNHLKNITVVVEPRRKTFRQDPINYLGFLVGSRGKFTIDNNARNYLNKFDPNDFVPMKKSLEDGKPLVMAAYFSPKYFKLDELPKHGGNGAALLGLITENAIFLPVAVNAKQPLNIKPTLTENNLYLLKKSIKNGRINVDVTIGKPFTLNHIKNSDRLLELLQKRKSITGLLSKGEQKEYLGLKKQLKNQSKIIMRHLAELLPPQKRGVWGKKEEQNLPS
ncbi:MAG: hypothetical protein HW400_453 [Candidatus Levybacteria bacterium]|nr:hypothetical protein [Candidatus Levybacteria bacterium]